MSYTIECRNTKYGEAWRASKELWPPSLEALIARAVRRIREEAVLNYRIKDEAGQTVWEWGGAGDPPGIATPVLFVPHARRRCGRYRVVR